MNENTKHSNLQNTREKIYQIINCNKLGRIVRSADNRKVFSKGDTTNRSYKLYTITETIHDTTPSYLHNFLPDGYNANLIRSTKM